MKRNLLPLLGIAFVVALAATGVFYGIFVSQLEQMAQAQARQQIVVAAHGLDRGVPLRKGDVRLAGWPGTPPPGSFRKLAQVEGKMLYTGLEENEPITEARLSMGKSTGGLTIARGMRAVPVRVSDSGGLLPFLKAGQRVDVQAVQSRGTPAATVRAILQNIELLSIQPIEPAQTVSGAATITLLCTPADADRVAAAESGGSIRLLLRNPLDEEASARPDLLFTSLFQDNPRVAPRAIPAALPRLTAAVAKDLVEFDIRAVRVGPGAMKALRPEFPATVSDSTMNVTLAPRALNSVLESAELLGSSRITGEDSSFVQARAGKAWQSAMKTTCGLAISLRPHVHAGKSIDLRVQPELTIPSGPNGTSTLRTMVDVSWREGQSILITGVGGPGEANNIAERLFGSAHWQPDDNLIILIVPKIVENRRPAYALARAQP